MSDSQKSQHKDRAPKSMIVWCNVPFCQLFIDFFWGGAHLQNAEVPRSGIKFKPQQ